MLFSGKPSHQLPSRHVRILFGDVILASALYKNTAIPSSGFTFLEIDYTLPFVHSSKTMISANILDCNLFKTDVDDSRETWIASERLRLEDTLHGLPDVPRLQRFIRPLQLSHCNVYARVLRPDLHHQSIFFKERSHTCSRCGQPDPFCTCSKRH